MTILGPHIRQQTVAWGEFYCPRCSTIRRYKQKCAIRHSNWHMLALFFGQVIDEFVECQTCWQTYRLEVLQYNQGLAANRLLLSVKYALESGVPAQVLEDELVSSGMNVTSAAQLVSSADKNQKQTCPTCGARQAGRLLRCRPCSKLLNLIR